MIGDWSRYPSASDQRLWSIQIELGHVDYRQLFSVVTGMSQSHGLLVQDETTLQVRHAEAERDILDPVHEALMFLFRCSQQLLDISQTVERVHDVWPNLRVLLLFTVR